MTFLHLQGRHFTKFNGRLKKYGLDFIYFFIQILRNCFSDFRFLGKLIGFFQDTLNLILLLPAFQESMQLENVTSLVNSVMAGFQPEDNRLISKWPGLQSSGLQHKGLYSSNCQCERDEINWILPNLQFVYIEQHPSDFIAFRVSSVLKEISFVKFEIIVLTFLDGFVSILCN